MRGTLGGNARDSAQCRSGKNASATEGTSRALLDRAGLEQRGWPAPTRHTRSTVTEGLRLLRHTRSNASIDLGASAIKPGRWCVGASTNDQRTGSAHEVVNIHPSPDKPRCGHQRDPWAFRHGEAEVRWLWSVKLKRVCSRECETQESVKLTRSECPRSRCGPTFRHSTAACGTDKQFSP